MHPALSLHHLDRITYPFGDISADGPGVVAAVAVNGESVWQRASGTAGDGAQLSTTTTFYVASVAKQCTAACVGILANDRSLDPDDAVVGYLPDLPRSFANVRVTDLVHHLSGIPSLETVAADDGWQNDWWHGLGTWDYVERICGQQHLDTSPGTVYRYSKEGYVLLAALVERVSGTTLATFAADRLFKPLGMHHTWYRDAPDARRSGATGHTGADGVLHANRTPFHFVGDGGLVSTAADLARWSLVFQDPFPLGRELPERLTTRGLMRDGSPLHYAWGVSSRDHHGLAMHSHGGQFVGNVAKLIRFLDPPFTTIICLANRDDLDLDQLARAVADTALAASLDASLPDWTETLPADGRHSPTHRALTTPAPNVPTGRPPGGKGASSAPSAGRRSTGRR